jgi:hypothetical protein
MGELAAHRRREPEEGQELPARQKQLRGHLLASDTQSAKSEREIGRLPSEHLTFEWFSAGRPRHHASRR